MEALAELLRRESSLGQVLLFKFVETRQLLRADETRFLAWAGAEVDRSRSRLREVDLLRAATSQTQADQFGLRAPITLAALAKVSPPPYRRIFDDQRRLLGGLVSEIEGLAADVVDLSHGAIAALASGRAAPAAGPLTCAVLSPTERETAYQSVLVAAGRLQLPSLVAFLA
ncbi:hypothetical protein BH20ACT2_BH20ACT2_25910 [soil metagenome]